MHLYMGATYVDNEPDIAVNAPAWQTWFTGLDQAGKIAWAEAYTGRSGLSHADALGIARGYAQAGGGDVSEHMIADTTVSYLTETMALARARQFRQILIIGGIGVAAWVILRPKKKRQ